MNRLRALDMRHGLNALVVLLALAAAAGTLARPDSPRPDGITLVLEVAAVVLMILALLLRRTAPFVVPTATCLVSAATVVHNDPDHTSGNLFFIPVLFGVGWLAGFALHERAAETEAAELRAALAERERESAARVAVAEERTRIAGELHDVVAHAVSASTFKHSGAGFADVHVRYGDGHLELEVRDQGDGPRTGPGHTDARGPGHGLVGIGERVKFYGGDLTAGASEIGGFALRARLPLHRALTS